MLTRSFNVCLIMIPCPKENCQTIHRNLDLDMISWTLIQLYESIWGYQVKERKQRNIQKKYNEKKILTKIYQVLEIF